MSSPPPMKPGQKNPTPTPGAADRVFYETLYRQKPSSEMAQQWCIENGVLPLAEATTAYKKYCKRKGITPGTSSSPVKPPKKKKSTSGKGKIIDDSAGGDTGMDAGSAFEGVGTVGA